MTIQEFKDLLRNGKVSFKYTKKDGTERVAIGTLNNEYIESESATPKGDNKFESDTIVRYYDINANGWRSFIFENLIEIIL